MSIGVRAFAVGPLWRLVGLVLYLALLTQACVPADTPTPELQTLNRGLSSDPETLDPHLFRSTESAKVIRDLREGLMTYSSDGRITLGAASNWSVSEDGLVYRFWLRENARWSDGKRLTAHDFVWGLRRVVDPQTASPWAEDLEFIQNASQIRTGAKGPEELGVSAIGNDQLEIRLDRPVTYFLEILAHPSTYPYRTQTKKSLAEEELANDLLVVNGPFAVSSREFGSAILLKKNDYYWDAENVSFDYVAYHIHRPEIEVRRFRAGELDITSSIDSASFSLVQRQLSTELRISPSLNVYFYGFNLRRGPFRGNKDLRRALAMAIDREKLVGAVTRRGEVPAYSFVPPNVANYESQVPSYAVLTQVDRNNMARELVEKARRSGVQFDSVDLRFNSGGGHESIAIAIQSMWRDVLSLEAELEAEEFKVFIDNVRGGEGIDVFRLSWKADYNDASSFLQLFQSQNPNNFTGFSDSEVDALLDAAQQAQDPLMRSALLQKVEAKVLSEQVVIPIYFFVNKHLVKEEVVGWEDNVSDIHLSKYLRLRRE